jgi:hypothetical protein
MTSKERFFSVTYVVLIIIAALLVGGLWYVRSRKA